MTGKVGHACERPDWILAAGWKLVIVTGLIHRSNSKDVALDLHDIVAPSS